MWLRSAISQGRKRANRESERRWRRFLEPLERRQLLSVYIAGNPNPFSSIQAAVDAAAAGATINVDPGVYSELVVVFKQLTIRGAKAGVDGRSNSRNDRAAESIVNGNLNQSGTRSTSFYLNADNIVLDGFIVEGQTAVGTYGAGIHMGPGRSGIQILNNIVQNNATGINFTNSSATNPLIIRRNMFRENNNEGPHSGRALYTDGTISGGTPTAGLNNVIIDQNAFSRNLGFDPGFLVQPAIGIEALSAQQTNIQITNNVFDRNGKHILAFNASGITITGNFFVEANDTSSAGIRFEGGVTNVTIQNNNIYGSGARGIRIDKKANSGNNANFTITTNNFFRNGVDAGGQFAALYINAGMLDGPVNATGNWWGATNGPSGDWNASVGSGDAVKIFGNTGVTVAPYSVNPIIAQQGAYWGTPQVVTSQINLEDYDQGGTGVAYSDSTSNNIDDGYRAYEGVDIDKTGSDYFLSNVKANEWVKYTVSVPSTGTYTLTTRVANNLSGGTFRVEIDSPSTSTGTINVPNTGSTTSFTDVNTPGIELSAGVHVLRVFFQAQPSGSGTIVGNFNWIKFTQTAVAVPTAPSSLAAVSVSGLQQVNLTWVDNSNNETGFIVERSSNGVNSWTVVSTVPANTTGYSDANPALAPGVRFYYHVRAAIDAITSANSNVASAVIWTPSVSAPSAARAAAISPTQVNVTWIDTVTNELSFKIERSTDGTAFSLLGTAPAGATTYSDTTVAAGTSYWYRVRASNASGDSYFSGPSKVTTPTPPPALPAPWTGADIGAVAAAGSSSESSDVFTIAGSGADIWNNADEFRYVYQPWSGNGTIVARVVNLQNTNAFAKAGVMFRETLAAGSKQVSSVMTPTSGVLNMDRVATNGASDGVFMAGSAPIWFKLVRNGNTFTASTSTNGTTWTVAGSTSVTMTANVFVGLAVCSKNDGVLNTATFDNVSVTSALSRGATADVTKRNTIRMISLPGTRWKVPAPIKRSAWEAIS
jgi:regulation of enolase protein 1 (concanavalin A-like superfamily)